MSKNDDHTKGALAEELLAEFLSNRIYSHYVYLNPVISGDRELCDVLIIFKNKAIVMQVKNKNLNKEELYKNKDIEKNAQQCRGAAKAIHTSNQTVMLKNQAGLVDEIDFSNINIVFCLSIMHQDAAWFGFYDDSTNNKVHIINFSSFQKVLKELNTLPELFTYLTDKENLLSSDKSMVLDGGEEELYALWVMQGKTFETFSKSTGIYTSGGLFESLTEDEDYLVKKSEDEKYGSVWSKLILTCQELGKSYKTISDDLVDENSLNRRMLGEAYRQFLHFSMSNKIPKRRLTHYIATPIDNPTKLYIFLFLGSDDDAIWFDQRTNIMQLMAHIFVKNQYIKYPTIQKIIGIATDSVFTNHSRFSFMHLTLNNEFIELCKSNQQLDIIAAQMNILQKDFKIGSIDEYKKGMNRYDAN